ncbi:hypothetical protein ATANTOWER_016401 [Ataeniobius toweri]|uniref:CUB domain-containing protein n=1 Tax=Ataeniobius toweri TaxID=208326 RepID=A0ABU7A812_9TELE|nr:hypothetical protein [Ataeniobius toweri]
MYIQFSTDSSVNNHGFEAAFDSDIEGCGETLTSPSGTITSPGHPTSYPHGASCTWYIGVSPGNLIRLSFNSFNLEYHSNCNYDYLEVYDGTGTTGNKTGRYNTFSLITLHEEIKHFGKSYMLEYKRTLPKLPHLKSSHPPPPH